MGLRLTGLGFPVGDHLLLAVSLPPLVVTVLAANVLHHPSDSALGFAGFFLVTVARIAQRQVAIRRIALPGH
jgi:hypothetical protein